MEHTTIDIKRMVNDIIEQANDALITLCKIKRSSDKMIKTNIDNRLQEFMMLDKLSQKIQEYPDQKEHLKICHDLMAKIVHELSPWYDDIFKEKPELIEIFKLFKKHGK